MSAQRRRTFLVAFQVLVAATYLIVTGMVLFSERRAEARFPAILAGAAVLALILRQGWLIPCTLSGPIVAVLTMPAIRSGLDAPMDVAGRIAFCTVAGLAVGLLTDCFQRISLRESAIVMNTTREQSGGPEDQTLR